MTRARTLVGLAALTAFVLLLTAAGLGPDAFTLAAVVAFIPLPFYIGIALWLDRFEPEPRGMLLMAFLWGTSVAIVISGILNGVMDATIGEWSSSVVSAPLIEEVLKGFILFRFYRTRKDEFDGVIDGLIYAAMVGLGFAFAENIDYYGRAFLKEGASGLAITFTLRGVIASFSHPLFTGLTGIGLGLARQSPRRFVQRLAPPAGLAGAVGLHSLWNAGASAGLIFFGIYAVVMMPALLALLVVAAFALKFEGRVIQRRLAGEAAAGLFSPAEYAQLCSVRGRMHASTSAFRHGGFAGWRTRRAYHRAASELAFLRQRAAHDGETPHAGQETAYLVALGAVMPSPPAESTSPDVPATQAPAPDLPPDPPPDPPSEPAPSEPAPSEPAPAAGGPASTI